MSITPEEIVNHQTWEILQDLREESLVPKDDGSFFYDTTRTVIVAGKNSPTRERKFAIVHKLARDEKAITIVEEVAPDWRGERNGFYLKLLQPQFEQVYDKYRKACDLTSHLNDYQERLMEGDDKLPEFNRVENNNNNEKVMPPTPIKHKGQMFETGGGGGYYNRNHPINPIKKLGASEIVDGFSSSNYPFVLMVSEGILTASEFGSAGEVNYRLQSAPGQLLMQERQLMSKFEEFGLFRNLGEDDIFAIATLRDVDTKTMKQIVLEIKNRQSSIQTKSEGKSKDSKVRYNQLLEEIRQSSNQASSNLKERYDKLIKENHFEKKDPQKFTEEKQTIECCGLFYSFSTNQLIYTGGKKDISPETREMKFFITLYRRRGQTVDYKTIAKEANLQSYKYLSENGEVKHEDLHNKDFSPDVSLLRRDFREIVLSLGMSTEDFSKMIKTITKTGYKLICQ